MRTFKTSGIQVWFGGEGCYSPKGSCLPDVDAPAGTYPSYPDNENEEVLYFEISDEESQQTTEEYSKPLTSAIEQGQIHIKNFFFTFLLKEMDYPNELVSDFEKDQLTIKMFKGNYFIVNVNAMNHTDIPAYNWK
ncbi:MAG: hypothetical protein R6V52_02175 [Bacteroidales bacterium]